MRTTDRPAPLGDVAVDLGRRRHEGHPGAASSGLSTRRPALVTLMSSRLGRQGHVATVISREDAGPRLAVGDGGGTPTSRDRRTPLPTSGTGASQRCGSCIVIDWFTWQLVVDGKDWCWLSCRQSGSWHSWRRELCSATQPNGQSRHKVRNRCRDPHTVGGKSTRQRCSAPSSHTHDCLSRSLNLC